MNNENLEFQIEVVPRGPDQAFIDALAGELLQHPALAEYLTQTRHRLLNLELIDPEVRKTRRVPDGPSQFQATFYDYTNNRTIRAAGNLADRQQLTIEEFGDQPLPNAEEFAEAIQVLMDDPDLGPALREQLLRPYAPMPPLAQLEEPNGRVERTITVGLLPRDNQLRHEIVGVNLIRHTVVRFEGGAPAGSLADFATCGLPDAGQPTSGRGTYVPGQAWVTISLAGTVLWRFLAVRPAASSGTNGSGIELRYVDYRGKRVLYRAHVPVLNVRYDRDACGPFLDWQREESMIEADGADVAPGFRLCPTPATTILDTGSDIGNFLGVGIYVQGSEVVLVSEMEAGWYRYVSEWRFDVDGTIRPRFGFGAVFSSCVCNRHHHHAYWRFDFDIRTPGNNIVQEFNDPPIIGGSNWHTKLYEIMRLRDPARNRKWLVQNARTKEGYEIIPGVDDGVATTSPDWPFPRGDVWILRYRGTEIDGGTVATAYPYGPFDGGIDGFKNGEAITNQDVVVWYAGHVTHDITAEPPGEFGHIVGPELKPVNW